MKFEGGVFKPTGNEPDSLESFFSYFSFVTRFFEKFNKTKLTLDDNIACYHATTTLLHGTAITVTHNLGYIPKTVTAIGRVEFVQILDSTVTNIKLKAKLLSASIMVPTPTRPQNRILVSDSTFFFPGDSIRIGGNVRDLVGIDRGRLILKENVTYDDSVNTVSLASETVRLFII